MSASIELQQGSAHELEVEFFHDAPLPLAGIRVGCRPPEAADAMERAVAAAAGADAAVVVVGLDPDWETEGRDRESFALPGRQDELVARVAAANPRTIVVVNAGSPVAMDWAEQTAAIALLWYPGQESGNALADVLFGDVDPGGRLPLTIPVRMEDTPAFLDVPGENLRIAYSEGLFVGHRWYDARAIEPRFAFGHGLSYARFEYRRTADRASARSRRGDDAACEIEIANTQRARRRGGRAALPGTEDARRAPTAAHTGRVREDPARAGRTAHRSRRDPDTGILALGRRAERLVRRSRRVDDRRRPLFARPAQHRAHRDRVSTRSDRPAQTG